MEIGNKIVELRKKNNLSQEDLAEKIGVARQTISKWELGETQPDIKQAKKLSNVFNISLDELVGNNIKDILIEKTSNTEKLAGIIIKILKAIGIIFIIFLVIDVVALVIYLFNHKSMDKLSDRTISITCNLHDKEYSYQFDFNEESGQIINAGGDGYLSNIIDIDKYSNAYQVLDIIDEYVKNHGGTCTRYDEKK